MKPHLILFDGTCPVCNLAVRHIISIDHRPCFQFAPLNGEDAKNILKNRYEELIAADTVILIENYRSLSPRISIRSKAFLRIYWIVGGIWKLPGVFAFFPSWIGDSVYRSVAKRRRHFL